MKNIDVESIRQRNLQAILPDEYGVIAEFCRNRELDTTVMSNLRSGKRSFTEHYARLIEKEAGWPRGYLDLEHPSDARPGSFEYVEGAITSAEFMDDQQKANLIGLIKTLIPSKP